MHVNAGDIIGCVCVCACVAKAVGLVITTSEDTLYAVRRQVEQMNRENDEDGEPRLSKEWRYLDSKSLSNEDSENISLSSCIVCLMYSRQ